MRETRGPRTNLGIYQPAMRGHMDDLTISATSCYRARWVISALEEAVMCARMKVKSKKSRTMTITKGRLTEQFHLVVQREVIPSVIDNPIKCL